MSEPDSSKPEDGPVSQIDKLFAKAAGKENTAAVNDEDQLNAFYGRSRRLGHTAAPSPFIAPATRQLRSVKLNIYADGYTIDDGPLLSMETDESKEFFAQMDRGVVPSSLAAQFPNSDIDVELNDFQKRKYVPPQRAAFQGDGRRLESGTGPAPSSVAVECPEGGEVEVDEGADDVTVVRIIGSKGEAKSFSLNASKHRVKDLYRLARKEEPDLGPFTLVVRSVPPKPLGEDAMEMTIEEANLKRAAISVRK